MASLSLRITLHPAGPIGPGKIALLEAIAAAGSISAAGRAMAMSYRRAWDLVEQMNAMFVTPVVARQVGGKNGGGATLTPLGNDLVARYRSIERDAMRMVDEQLRGLESEIAPSVLPAADQAGERSTRSLPR